MFCPNCGKKVKKDTQKFCTYCGTKLFKPKTNDIEEQKKEVTEKTQEQVECVINNEVVESTQEVEANNNNGSSVECETIAEEEQDTTVVMELPVEDEVTGNQTQVEIEEANNIATNEPSGDDIDTHSDSLPEENTYIENDIEEHKEETTYRNSALQRWAKEEREEREKIANIKNCIFKYKIPIVVVLLVFVVIILSIKIYNNYNLKNKSSDNNLIIPKQILEPIEKSKDSNDKILPPIQHIKNGKYMVYINENGDEIIKLPWKKNHYYGMFSENRIVVFHDKTNYDKGIIGLNCQGMDLEPWVGSIKIYNEKGQEIVTKMPNNLTFCSDGVATPKYKNGVLAMDINEHDTSITDEYGQHPLKQIFIDKNGQKISKPKNYKEEYGLYGEEYTPKTTTNGIKMVYSGAKFGYKNSSGRLIIPYKFEQIANDDWWSNDSNFYNGIAYIYSERRYINTKGNYINNEIYDYGEPFYFKIAFVAKENTCGFINTSGTWIYKTKCEH